jgi:hypothetical protein
MEYSFAIGWKSDSKVRVSIADLHKKRACPARVAEAGQENIRTVHEPKPIQTAEPPCGQGRRAMEGLHGPQTQILEGACAIKVSMSCAGVRCSFIKAVSAHGPFGCICSPSRSYNVSP